MSSGCLLGNVMGERGATPPAASQPPLVEEGLGDGG
jgi:hypothetical protein